MAAPHPNGTPVRCNRAGCYCEQTVKAGRRNGHRSPGKKSLKDKWRQTFIHVFEQSCHGGRWLCLAPWPPLSSCLPRPRLQPCSRAGFAAPSPGEYHRTFKGWQRFQAYPSSRPKNKAPPRSHTGCPSVFHVKGGKKKKNKTIIIRKCLDQSALEV